MAVGQLKSSPPSSTPSPSRRPNLPSLTGARWWAAMLVYVLHALVFLPVYPFQKSELFRQIHTVVPMQLGSAGVTFFFILSGFLIYWSNSEVSGVSDALYYCRRRLTKIFPMHLITLVMFVLASATVTASSITWALSFDRLKVWLPNALLIHTWNPDWAVLGGMNVPSWSLCAEMLFYLTFPLFVPLVRRVRGRGNWWALGAMFAVSLGIITVVHLLADGPKTTENFFVPRLWPQDVSPVADVHADPVWFSQDHIPVLQSYWLSYYFPLTRLVEFYLGVFAAKLVWEKQFRNTDLILPLILLGMSYGTTWFVPIAFKMSVLMSLPMTYVIATLAVRDIEGVSRFIASPLSVLLGNISFAFYMVQFPVMVFVQRYFVAGGEYGFFGWLLAAVGSFVLSVALAWVLFTFVDDPLMRATARKPARRPAHAATRTR
ncbi:acyltransferase [Corynebacterium durum]|uniref:acyltransferase family protein n=1 Tax=Corynebacterium durum TaxID=61592 RepID=UPI0028E7A315|nr:acyltransferase [Corynebacterium durum]